MLDLDGKKFALISNTAGNASAGETIFTFQQSDQAVRATYEGGGVVLGAIIGQIESENRLNVLFQQVTSDGKLCGGEGRMDVRVSSDGKLQFIDDLSLIHI